MTTSVNILICEYIYIKNNYFERDTKSRLNKWFIG